MSSSSPGDPHRPHPVELVDEDSELLDGAEEDWWDPVPVGEQDEETDEVEEDEDALEGEELEGCSDEDEEAPEWPEDDEDLDGFEDVESWASELEEDEEILLPEAPLVPLPTTEPLPKATLGEDDDSEELEPPPTPSPQVVGWAPRTFLFDGLRRRPIATICSTAEALSTLYAPDERNERGWLVLRLGGLALELEPSEQGGVQVHADVEERRIHGLSLAYQVCEGSPRLVLGRDALALGRLVVDPAR